VQPVVGTNGSDPSDPTEVDAAAATSAATDRQMAALLWHEAAMLRADAARDRQEAALLRHQAALDKAAASTDELTGALNRRGGLVALQNEVDRCRRGPCQLVLGFVDVDGLKQVNDVRGHLAGDELLKEVADGLRTALRSYDVLMRFGGDEFVYSFAGASLADALQRFAAMRTTLAHLNGDSVSAGFAELTATDRLEDLIGRADEDLYRRRGRVVRLVSGAVDQRTICR
jgi:diguanylate cyclase (GGDEF)-like protein